MEEDKTSQDMARFMKAYFLQVCEKRLLPGTELSREAVEQVGRCQERLVRATALLLPQVLHYSREESRDT